MLNIVILLSLIISSTFAQDLAEQELITANNIFSASVYSKISQSSSDKNFIVSPFSAEIVLAFVQSGAKGETAEEIRTALHLPNSKEEIERGFKKLLRVYSAGDGFYILQTVSRMFMKKKFPVNATFKRNAKLVYNAEIEFVDFLKRKKTTKAMNNWAERNSKNKIREFISPNILDRRTRVILLNLIYFKGNWSNPFPLSLTRKSLFYKNLFETVSVDIMYQNDAHLYNYVENFELGAKFLEVPFRSDDVSMIICLPNSKNGISSLETQIEKVLQPQDFSLEYVKFGLPKFSIKTRLHLKNLMKMLGVNKVFDKNADLSGIAGKKGDLHLSEVLAKSFINVSESGLEAAAAAAAETDIYLSYAPKTFGETRDFIIDHPFIFYVKIKKMIVFVGRVLDPTK